MIVLLWSLTLAQHRKASVRLGSFRFVETAHRVGSVHAMAGSFRFARHCGSVRFGSVRGNRKQGRFGSCNGRFVSVRVTLRFGSFRFVVAGREVFDRMCRDDSG